MKSYWKNSIYSDGTSDFVSNPVPRIGEKVSVSVRFLADSPVTAVYLKRMVNGAERYQKMSESKQEGGLSYNTAEFTVNEPRIVYNFMFVTPDGLVFYTQAGVFSYIPDESSDFVLLADYRQPEWVDGAVFYQIFPERFANGNPDNDVKNGEFVYRGHPAIRMEDWYDEPLTFQKGYGLDFFGGDLEGITEKIPYLKELGVNVIYLNPIFTAYSTHKYDCVDYFHVDPHFGGDEALAELCTKLHENDMRIVLDISINHTGIENAWTEEHREFYFQREDGSLACWEGVDTLPELDYRNEELRDLVYRGPDSAIRKWLRPPYSIDGWRFDVADVFARNDDVQLSDEVWREVCDAIREENPEAMIIGEHWGDCASYLQGDLWNTPMNYFGFGRIIREFCGLNDLFLERKRELITGHKMTAGELCARTDAHYSKIPSVIADCQMNLFDSHDVARMHNYDLIDFDRWKLAVTAQLLWRGIPCVYYGDECMIDGFTEQDAGFRYPMPWGRETEEGRKAYELYQKVIKLRRENPVFARGGRKVLLAEGYILAVARFFEGKTYVGVLSMEQNEKTVAIPLDITGAKELKYKEDVFGAKLVTEQCEDGLCTLKVPAHGSLLFEVI